MNLCLIYDALNEYRERRGHWPAKLAELVPEFVADPAILLCPTEQERWERRSWTRSFVDHGFEAESSYSYEFNGALLEEVYWRGLPRKTVREWKQEQARYLGEQGGMVPVARCFKHSSAYQNLGLDGAIYNSGLFWEDAVTKPIDRDRLKLPGRLFGSTPKPITPASILPRPADAPPNTLDLTDAYNGLLTEDWQGFPGNDLSQMPQGIQILDGIAFDIRGVAQTGGFEAAIDLPKEIEGICVARRFKRIHVLHGATLNIDDDPPPLGVYILHYADGDIRELKVVRGDNIDDWWVHRDSSAEPPNATVAWAGVNDATLVYGTFLRIYHASWDNPRPEAEISSISLRAYERRFGVPFVLAITVEP